MSPHSYTFNNPINWTDSTGMCPDGKCPDDAKKGDTHEWDGQTWISDGKGNWNRDGGNLDEVVIGTSKSSQIQKTDLLLVQGLSTTGNRLFGKPYDPEAITKLTEDEKQQHFKTSAEKTVAILMYEFASGTAPDEPRIFDENTAIAENIKWSHSNATAMKAFLNTDNIVDGIWYDFYVPFSPDKTSLGNSVKAHLKAKRDMTFYFGGMVHYIKKAGIIIINFSDREQYNLISKYIKK